MENSRFTSSRKLIKGSPFWRGNTLKAIFHILSSSAVTADGISSSLSLATEKSVLEMKPQRLDHNRTPSNLY